MKKTKILVLLGTLLLLIALGATFLWLRPTRSLRVARMSAFHYQLQGYAGDFIDRHSGDRDTLFVIDPSRDGGDSARFRREEISRLKNGGRNLVLAYLSIGEAEAARWYFPGLRKDLIGEPNPVFPDNYLVHYWDPEWQRVIAGERDSSLSRILDQGFDGVYLDLVDAYLRFPGRATAAREMVEWVARISAAGRKRDRAFVVFAQNAPCLPDPGTFPQLFDEKELKAVTGLYWASVDGIGAESSFFSGPRFEDNELAPQEEALRCLDAFPKRGKRVFGVEYVRDPAKQARALEEMRKRGIVGIVTDRKLRGEFFKRTPR